MNRNEFIGKLATTHDLTKAEAGRVVQTVIDTIIESVRKGDGLSITGFGSFRQVAKAARKARNPHTGETIKVAARKVPKFVPGAAFVAAVDPKRAAAKAAARGDGGTAGTRGGARKGAAKAAAPKGGAARAGAARSAAPGKAAAKAPAKKAARRA